MLPILCIKYTVRNVSSNANWWIFLTIIFHFIPNLLKPTMNSENINVVPCRFWRRLFGKCRNLRATEIYPVKHLHWVYWSKKNLFISHPKYIIIILPTKKYGRVFKSFNLGNIKMMSTAIAKKGAFWKGSQQHCHGSIRK